VRTRIVVSHALLDRFGNCGIVTLLNPCETEIAMLVGYARTSTVGQIAGLEAQERELRAAGCDKVFREQVSSVAERQQLEAALDYVREGDSFTVTKLDRLARSVGDLLAIVSRLEAKGVSLRVLSMSGTQSLDTSTATGRLMLSVIGAVGQA
jgi:DNA invertase Pin-like site-specific DNA recombinase